MIRINNPADCCGCTACASICNHDAITMEPDALGFLYPKVDESKCVECGLCEKVCAFNDNYDKSLNLPKPDAYAARHKDISKLRYSRSGAAFVALSDDIIQRGGVIYGAGYEGFTRVIHKRAVSKSERDEFRGSKYVQSDLRGVFKNVKKDLQEGRIVLFSGTPCQTAALHSYIGNRYRANLYLVDIICHSVPSPAIWRDYVNYIENKYNSKIIKLEFRDKSIGWYQTHLESFTFADGCVHKDFLLRILFNAGYGTRPSCQKCKFANIKRPSDITIGDFWGYEKVASEMNVDNKGISLVLCNTEKGQQLFSSVRSDLNSKQVPLESALQPNLQHPSSVDPEYDQFAEDYKNKGFVYIGKKYANIGYRYKLNQLLQKIKRHLP